MTILQTFMGITLLTTSLTGEATGKIGRYGSTAIQYVCCGGKEATGFVVTSNLSQATSNLAYCASGLLEAGETGFKNISRSTNLIRDEEYRDLNVKFNFKTAPGTCDQIENRKSDIVNAHRMGRTTIGGFSGLVLVPDPQLNNSKGSTIKLTNEIKESNKKLEVWQSPYSAHAVSLVVRSYLANQRQATSKVKSRGEVKGSTRKIYRQKGTGGARHGSRYAPQFRGGGISFGPTGQENYHCQINKKTKEANKFLTQLKLNAKKVLIIFSTQESKNEATKRAFRDQIIITGLEAKDYRNIDLDHPVVFTPKQLVGNEYSLKAKNASLWEKFRSTSYSTIDNEIKPGEIDQAQKEKKITID
ncbi:3818_t:CDS:2 [Entrophospora sp. SA101]|nr:3818_t:CDS:2 [Entrophospora sp. SA101]